MNQVQLFGSFKQFPAHGRALPIEEAFIRNDVQEEMHRLFNTRMRDLDKSAVYKQAFGMSTPPAKAALQKNPADQILEEFRNIGIDSEYCPDSGFWESSFLTCSTPSSPHLTSAIFHNKQHVRCKKRKSKLKTYCVFCKNNEVMPSLYSSHLLKDTDGKTTCPVLRKYICPICYATGDFAHTLKYCPLNINGWSGH